MIIALTYIHGIGRTKAPHSADKLGSDHSRRVQDLSDAEVLQIREAIDADHTVEGDLRRQTAMNIKRLMDLACYRGLRHRKGLTVRGQRTHPNARTRQGQAKPNAGKKKSEPHRMPSGSGSYFTYRADLRKMARETRHDQKIKGG